MIRRIVCQLNFHECPSVLRKVLAHPEDFILLSEVPAVTVGSSLLIQGPHSSPRRLFLWLLCIVTVSSRDVDFIKQIKGKNMSEWNIKTRLSSASLVARRHRLHLLTASQRESEEITKTGFYFTPSPSLRFPFQCGHDGCSVTDLICLFHLAL